MHWVKSRCFLLSNFDLGDHSHGEGKDAGEIESRQSCFLSIIHAIPISHVTKMHWVKSRRFLVSNFGLGDHSHGEGQFPYHSQEKRASIEIRRAERRKNERWMPDDG
jgi:hypothetical protein